MKDFDPSKRPLSADNFNREDSMNKREDAPYKSFARDKRARTTTPQRIDYKSRPTYSASNDRSSNEGGDFKRRSYNPNFSRENKPYGERDFNSIHDDAQYQPRPRRTYDRGEGGSYNRNAEGGGNYNRNNEGGGSYNRREGSSSYAPRREGYNRSGSSYNREGSSYNRGSYNREGGSSYNREGGSYNREGEASYNREGGSYNREGASSYGRPQRSFDRPNRPYDKSRQYDRQSSPRPYDRNRRPMGRPTPRFDSENYPKYPAPKIETSIRLNRYIAMSGICSRREADTYITAGVVTVNDQVVTELGTKVTQNDVIKFNDETIQNEKKVYIVMNKPKGYVTSLEDPHADKTVMELLNNACKERIYPVGRLDKSSMGVLLITNDGDLAKHLTHPTYEKKKIYQVTLDKPLTNADMDKVVAGVVLEDGEIHADAASYVGDKKNEIGVEIHSGKNRIVRRMFEAVGYKVVKLDRVYFAGLTKQKLKRGAWRFLTPREVSMLKAGTYE